jgi:hypothetical protein
MKIGNYGTGKTYSYITHEKNNGNGNKNNCRQVSAVLFGILSFIFFCYFIYSEITTY